jgi:hypothetical protein
MSAVLNRLPSWSSLLAKAGLAAGPSSLGGLPTWDSLKESLSSFGQASAKSAGGYVPTWDGVKKSASSLGSDLKAWIPQGATKLPSVASLTARLDGLKESIPSISSLREKLPGLSGVGLGASLPTLSSLTGKLPQFSDLVPRLPSVGDLPSLGALGERLAALQNRIPSVATVRTRAAAGAAVLGGYGRRALGSADTSHDTEYGLGIVAALVLAALLGLKLKDSAASVSQTSSSTSTPAAASSGGGAVSKGLQAPRDTSGNGSNPPVGASPASGGTFSLVDSVLAGGSMATAGVSGDRSLPTPAAAAVQSVAPGGVGSGVLTAQLNGGGPALGVAGTADSAIRGVSTSPGSGVPFFNGLLLPLAHHRFTSSMTEQPIECFLLGGCAVVVI